MPTVLVSAPTAMQNSPFFPTVPLPLLMSCLGKFLAGAVSRCLPHSLRFGASFSTDGRVFVLQACYQHPMPNQQHQHTEGTIDGITANILKALGHTGKHEPFEICLDIYRKGQWLSDFTESIIIPIKKKVTNKEVLVWDNEASSIIAKWFGAGSIDGLDMFSGRRTYSMTLLKAKCWARLIGVGKGWSYCMIWWKGEIMDSWKI